MGQTEVQAIFDEYIVLRGLGMDSNTALQPLRPRIETLSAAEKTDLVRLVRGWEKRDAQGTAPKKAKLPGTSTLAKTEHGVIRKVSPLKTEKVRPVESEPETTSTQPLPSMKPKPAPPAAEPSPLLIRQLDCPNCGKPNPANELFCAFCGHFLQQTASTHGTVKLDDGDPRSNPDYFGMESTLVLFVRHNKNQFKVKPQEYGRELVIGRSDGNTLKPDIDLSNQDAGRLGVSRMHLSLVYEREHNTLNAMDMRSSNGSFVNNQRLHAHEVRVLRHGDELRLGHFVMSVYFQHEDKRG